MKTRTETAKKTQSSRPPRHAVEPGGSGSSAGGDACPREQMIAEAAYFRAERRGFAPGNEMSDWLQAEADVERVREQ